MKVKAIHGFPSRLGSHRAGQEFEISRADLEAAGSLDLVEIIEDDPEPEQKPDEGKTQETPQKEAKPSKNRSKKK